MRFSLLMALLLLTACSSPVPTFILAPQLIVPQTTQLQQANFTFSLADSRSAAHTLRIIDGGKTHRINTRNDMPQQIEQTFRQALQDQGANLNPNSDTRFTLHIVRLMARVDQRALDHAVTNDVEFRLTIEDGQNSFTKSYSGEGNFTAPFKVDVATVERELRLLTEQVLTQILQDQSWHIHVRG